MTTFSPNRPPNLPGRASFLEWFEGLLWPKLFVAPMLAIRAGRIGIGFVMVALIALLSRLPELWLGADGPAKMITELSGPALRRIGTGVARLDEAALGGGIWAFVFEMPRAVLTKFPFSTVVMLIPVVIVWSIGGGAISRMAALEFSLSVHTAWPRSLGFAISRAQSFAGSLLAPLFIVVVVGFGLAAAGFLLFSLPVVQILGGLLYGVMLVAGLIAVIGLVGYGLGMHMLVPAVACEGTDAIDAIQRAYAYVLGRPARLIVYSAILVVQFVVLAAILGMISRAVVDFTGWASGAFLQDSARDALMGSKRPAEGTMAWSARLTAWLISFWSLLPHMIAVGTLVSFYFSGSTVLYLLARQANDGQDPTDLWSPGMIEGTRASVTGKPAEAVPEDEEAET